MNKYTKAGRTESFRPWEYLPDVLALPVIDLASLVPTDHALARRVVALPAHTAGLRTRSATIVAGNESIELVDRHDVNFLSIDVLL